jgi:hypothetical protein
MDQHPNRRRAARVTNPLAYAELDEILRGTGRSGAIGMSAIDGLIAALVAAPSFVHAEKWLNSRLSASENLYIS